jgi:hypothetical protein
MKRTRDRVAIYVRASTLEQDLAGQRKGMLDEARRRGWKVTAVYAEAKSSRVHRPEFDRLYKLAMQRRHDAVFVWRLDRLGRGLIEVVTRVRELHDQGASSSASGPSKASPELEPRGRSSDAQGATIPRWRARWHRSSTWARGSDPRRGSAECPRAPFATRSSAARKTGSGKR